MISTIDGGVRSGDRALHRGGIVSRPVETVLRAGSSIAGEPGKRAAHKEISILLAERRALLRAGMREALDRANGMSVLGEVFSCADAVAEIGGLAPDVVIVGSLDDCSFPIEATRRIAASYEQQSPRLLVLVDVRDSISIASTLNDRIGVLLDNAGPEELTAALRMLSAGYSFLTPALADGPSRPPARSGEHSAIGPTNMTGRELDVIRLLAAGHTNIEISKRLTLSESTVKSHVQHLLTKLGLRNRVSIVIYAYETGLIRTGGNLRNVPLRYDLD
jgi:DNA-binding NarL/FixJ family response regulator